MVTSDGLQRRGLGQWWIGRWCSWRCAASRCRWVVLGLGVLVGRWCLRVCLVWCGVDVAVVLVLLVWEVFIGDVV